MSTRYLPAGHSAEEDVNENSPTLEPASDFSAIFVFWGAALPTSSAIHTERIGTPEATPSTCHTQTMLRCVVAKASERPMMPKSEVLSVPSSARVTCGTLAAEIGAPACSTTAPRTDAPTSATHAIAALSLLARPASTCTTTEPAPRDRKR